jgi:hypothetical protein
MPEAVRGEELLFTNRVQETPIGEFDTYYIHDGAAPRGIARLEYVFSGSGNRNNPNLTDLLTWIEGRYPVDERSVLVADPARGGGQRGSAANAPEPAATLPLVHLVIPSDYRSTGISSEMDVSRMPQYLSYSWHTMHAGLDGLRVTIPALDVEPLADGLFPLNLRVMDPIWPLRKMLDISFSVRPGEERILWLDLRDRILPDGKPLYLTLAGAEGLEAAKLSGLRVELIFKPWDEAKAEHVADRFTQARDNYAMICEERPNNRRLNKYTQLENDLTDLLRVDPTHKEGREYWYIYNGEQPRPQVKIEPAPAGVPVWAHLQLKYLGQYRAWAEWVIDNRQIENGEFGGGLSDDSDFGNWLPGLSAMGVMPEKIDGSVGRMMEVVYANGMLDRGMSVIQSDGLHTFEEGTNVIGQINLLRVGDPKEVERLMEAAHSVRHHLLGVDAAGHTHFRSDYFSRTKLADEGVWAWSSPRQSLHLIPAIYLGELYGHREAKQEVIDMADGFLAHATVSPDGRTTVHSEINFETGETRSSGMGNSTPVFWAAWRWTGDPKYLKPITDQGAWGMSPVTSNMIDIASLRAWAAQQAPDDPTAARDPFSMHLGWQTTGDKRFLETLYTELISEAAVREYSNTLGYVWTDRMVFDIETIQRARLGGIVQNRNLFFPGHAVSWRFDGDRTAEQVAILVPYATPEEVHIELFNISARTVTAQMTGWDVLNGRWEMVQGIDTDGDGAADGETAARTATFGREQTFSLELAPMRSTIVRMKLKGRGVRVTERPDLAIGRNDVRRQAGQVSVTVHNLGGAASKSAAAVLRDPAGNPVSRATVPALPGAGDLLPKTAEVVFSLPEGTDPQGYTVTIDPDDRLPEIRKTNNSYTF